jgi:hypothetical protein
MLSPTWPLGRPGYDAGKPGFAFAQVTTTALAQPGDFFNVIMLASAWTAGDPPIPFPSPWVPGSQPPFGPSDYSAIDNNQFHTYFWGTDVLPSPPDGTIASLQVAVADIQSSIGGVQTSIGSLQSNTAKLQQNVGSLQNRVAAIETLTPGLIRWPSLWGSSWGAVSHALSPPCASSK